MFWKMLLSFLVWFDKLSFFSPMENEYMEDVSEDIYFIPRIFKIRMWCISNMYYILHLYYKVHYLCSPPVCKCICTCIICVRILICICVNCHLGLIWIYVIYRFRLVFTLKWVYPKVLLTQAVSYTDFLLQIIFIIVDCSRKNPIKSIKNIYFHTIRNTIFLSTIFL